MRNYGEIDHQVYARPSKCQIKKLNVTTELKPSQQIKLAKSPKKLSYAIHDLKSNYNKENQLANCRSNVSIPGQKSLHKTHRKSTSSFLNKSQATFGQKNYNVPLDDKKRIKSRWQTVQYVQPFSYNNAELNLSPPTDMENSVSPKTGKLRQNLTSYNSMSVNQYNAQPYQEKKTNYILETTPDEGFHKFGTENSYKSGSKDKNIPFYERLKEYSNDTAFASSSSSNQNNYFMSNTYSYSDYKDLGQSQSYNKFINSTISSSKLKPFYGNLDSYDLKTTNQTTYAGPRVERSSINALTLSKNFQNKIQVTKDPQLDDFIIGACKGEGRFGKVYMAIHKKTGFLCALKKIKKQSVQYMMDQFIQEIKIQLYLNHPKLVKIYGYFADKEHFYMLVQYMQEGSLYSLMKKNKKFQENEAAQKLNQICQGIKQMHDQNIVHRDLKPQNVVMSNGVCKICDFGWAAICSDRRQTYCGTLDYVCPEIVQGNAYDSGADIWCIGVLAYQLMCGKAPFYDISRQKTIEKIKSCKIDSFPPHLSKKAIKFIQMVLKKDPDSRVGIQELLDSQFLRSTRK